MIGNYGSLAIWGFLALTQLLSIFWVAVTFNTMVWHYSELAAMLVSVVSGILYFLAYEEQYAVAADTMEANAAEAATAQGVMSWMESMWAMEHVAMNSAMITLMVNYPGWWAGQWDMTPEEDREEFKEWLREEMEKKMEMKKEMKEGDHEHAEGEEHDHAMEEVTE